MVSRESGRKWYSSLFIGIEFFPFQQLIKFLIKLVRLQDFKEQLESFTFWSCKMIESDLFFLRNSKALTYVKFTYI